MHGRTNTRRQFKNILPGSFWLPGKNMFQMLSANMTEAIADQSSRPRRRRAWDASMKSRASDVRR